MLSMGRSDDFEQIWTKSKPGTTSYSVENQRTSEICAKTSNQITGHTFTLTADDLSEFSPWYQVISHLVVNVFNLKISMVNLDNEGMRRKF